MSFKERMTLKIKKVDRVLQESLPTKNTKPTVLHEAMAYSVEAGGKRLRPVLVLAAAETLGADEDETLLAAAALELIHTYSLIHDDLPAMDNDDYRRGRLTNHKVFGEAVAILAGDALLTKAFELLTKVPSDPYRKLRVIQEIAIAAGSEGMIGGQVADMEAEKRPATDEELLYIHQHKTGDLITVSIRVGAILSGATDKELEHLSSYAHNIGLAFQIIDDILDIEGDSDKLGKSVGSDLKNEKTTYPSLYGLPRSKELAQEAIERALDSLEIFGEKADFLRDLAKYIIARDS